MEISNCWFPLIVNISLPCSSLALPVHTSGQCDLTSASSHLVDTLIKVPWGCQTSWPISISGLFFLDYFASLTFLTTLILFPLSLWHYLWFSSLFPVCSEHPPSACAPTLILRFCSQPSASLITCSSLVTSSDFLLFTAVPIWQVRHSIKIC